MEMKIIYLATMVILVVSGCYNCEKEMRNSFIEYNKFVSHDDSVFLKNSYKSLQNYYNFCGNNDNLNYFKHTVLVYCVLKDYDGLLRIVKTYKPIDEGAKEIKILNENFINYLDKKDPKFIYENLSFIKSKINKNPKDSLNYIDYFFNKLFISSEAEFLAEIDSISNQNLFSEMFYEYVLKKDIQEYHDILLSK